MMMIVSTMILITPEDFQVKATGGGSASGNENNVGINTIYIQYITEELSNIVQTYDRGRSFGTDGEHLAASYIKNQMNDLGLDNVHNESITGTAQHPDLNKTLEIISMGIKINGTQTITDCYISPRWNTTFKSLILPQFFTENTNLLTHNFSYENLPVYRKPNFPYFDALFNDSVFWGYLLENLSLKKLDTLLSFAVFFMHQLEIKYDFIYENINVSDNDTLPSWYNGSLPESKCGPHLFIDEDPNYNPDVQIPEKLIDEFEPLSTPRIFYHSLKLIIEMCLWRFSEPDCIGLIRYDFNNDTYNMVNGLLMRLPLLFINGSVGRPIYENATEENESNRKISFWINQRYNSMKSYNVIGQINGTNPNKTVLCDCLYDSWWNQGTADAAVGMGTVLAIAKYFKNHSITPKYTLKFVAFGGEEYGYLGAQHYNDTHTNENITMVIDLNQIGFSQTGPHPQTMYIHTNDDSLMPLL